MRACFIIKMLSVMGLVLAAQGNLQLDIAGTLIDPSCQGLISGNMYLDSQQAPWPSTQVAGPDGFPQRYHVLFEYDEQLGDAEVDSLVVMVGAERQAWRLLPGALFYQDGPSFPLIAPFTSFSPCATDVNQIDSSPQVRIESISPNPFNAETTIIVKVDVLAPVSIKLYDVTGKKVRTVSFDKIKLGMNSVGLNGDNLPSGLYFLVLEANELQEIRRVLILK